MISTQAIYFINRFLPQSSLKRNVLILSSVTMVGQVFTVLLSPIWTRLYSSSDFGVFGAYSSVLAIIMAIASLSYEQAIPIASDDDIAADVLVLSIYLVLIVGSVSTILLLLLGPLFVKSSNLLKMSPYIWLIPVGVLLSGIYQALNFWALRNKAISIIAKSRITQIVGGQTIIGLFGLIAPSPLGFIFSGIFSSSGGISLLATNLHLKQRGGIYRFFKERKLLAALSRYSKFPLINTPSVLLNRLGLYLPSVLMLSYFGAEAAGWLVLSQRIISLPVELFGGALSQVFQSEAAEIIRNDPSRLKFLIGKITINALKISPFILVTGFAAPYIVPIVFGQKWQEAGYFVLYLSFFSAIGIIISPITSIPALTEQMRGQLFLNLLRALLVFLSFYIPYRLKLNPSVAVMAFSGVMSINYILYYLFCRYIAQKLHKNNYQVTDITIETL
jgi:O-antigen/teichoic acid export membrane protein